MLQKGEIGSKAINRELSRLRSVGSAAPVNAVAATRVLTMDTQPTAADTVTIGTTVYTWVASGAEAGEINVGADLAAAKLNLVAAINGTDEINEAHTLVTAAAFSGDTMTITAVTKGTAGNAIATTETFTAGTNVWAGATMTGGVDGTVAVADTAVFYSGYLYYTPTEATTSTASWVRAQFSTY